MVAAVLLASRDLWTIQAEAVGGMLSAAGVTHDVVTDPDRLDVTEVGARSRGGNVRQAHAPLVGLPVPDAEVPRPVEAIAFMVFALAAVGALAMMRVPGPLKGAVFIVLIVVGGTLAYGAWISPLPPLDVSGLLIDWRTSALAPACGIAFVFAYDIYPLPGSFVVKTFWLSAALALTAVFSTVRLALVAAGYVEFGPSSFLALSQLGGVFWDIAPGLAVLALAHASLAYTLPRRRRWWSVS